MNDIKTIMHHRTTYLLIKLQNLNSINLFYFTKELKDNIYVYINIKLLNFINTEPNQIQTKQMHVLCHENGKYQEDKTASNNSKKKGD